MTRTIVKLLRDGEKRRILSDYARKRAADKFSWERIAKQYEAVFEAVASTAPSDIEKR
jgi:glycosyltransferase involved in cell wall biosynthesis